MKKKKIIILIICISAFLAIGGFMTYAINVKIEYNYNLTVDAPRILALGATVILLKLAMLVILIPHQQLILFFQYLPKLII